MEKSRGDAMDADPHGGMSMEKKEAVYYWENLRKTFSEYAEKEENIWAKQHYQFSVEAIDAALDALKMSETSEPLTMEQLREAPHGKIKDSTLQSICDRANEIACKPANIDRETWEKPCSVCGGKTTLYQQTNTTKPFMNTFGKKATLVTECMACPPYADCCMKDISVNSAFKIKFCPECGRPLTKEAWDEMKKRLRGCLE